MGNLLQIFMAWWIVFNFTIGSAVAAESQTGAIKLDTRPVFDGMSAAQGWPSAMPQLYRLKKVAKSISEVVC